MEKSAIEIQKERVKELEEKANALIERCGTATLGKLKYKGELQ